MNQTNTENSFRLFKPFKASIAGKKAFTLVLILLYGASMLALLTATPAFASSQSTVVKGTVTDEAGVGVADVAVTVTSSGTQILTTYTDSYGNFTINNLDFGTYNLVLTKTGYAQLVQSIMVNMFGQHLGIMTLSPALNFTTSILSQVANPSDQITFSVNLKNSGGETETSNLSIFAPDDWTVRVLNGNSEVSTIVLAPQQIVALQLEVMVPSTTAVNQAYGISLNASGIVDSSMAFTVLVTAQSAGIVTGTVVDDSSNGLSEVTVYAYDSNGLLRQTAQTSSTGSFSIEIPTSTPIALALSKDGYADTTKNVNLSSSGQTMNLGKISLQKTLQLASSVIGTTASPGDTLKLPFTVTNAGVDPRTLTFSASYPTGWSAVVLDSTGREVISSSLSAGAISNFQLEVTVPISATGDYNLTLSAAGKATSTLGFDVNVGAMNSSLLSCQFTGMSVSLGNSAQFAISLTNPFSVAMRFKVWVDSVPSGWTTSVETSTGDAVTEILLNANQATNLVVAVQSPDDAATGQTYNLMLKAEPVGQTLTSSLQLSVGLTAATSDSLMSCQFPGISVTPGDSARFTISLTNIFSVATSFKVSVDSVPSNWTASVKTNTGDTVTEILLGAGQSVNLGVQVETSASSATGQTYNLTVNAQSTTYNLNSSIPVTVALTEAINEVTLTASLPEIAITAGNAADYSITVANLGVTDRLLFLSSEVPSGWNAVFKSGNTEVTTLYLYSGNTSALTLVVTPPGTVSVGSYSIPIHVKSDSGAELDSLNLTTTITGSYEVSLSLSTYLTSATSGGTTSFTATVTNSGFSTLTDVALDITLPESDWEYTVSPVQVGTLGSKESVSFNIVVTTPSSTVSGDYMVTVAGSSGQTNSSASQVRVTISTSTSWGLYGVGIAVVFIVILVLVFKKFKRR
jgi:uncharacterized membrane protein